MSTENEQRGDVGTKKPPGRRINRGIIVVGVVGGFVFLVLGLAQDEPVSGLISMAIVYGFVALWVIGARHSDTIALMSDDIHDERHVHIHRRAALITVNVLALALVAAAIVDFASGGSGTPYTWLIAIAGATYFGVVFLLSRRN